MTYIAPVLEESGRADEDILGKVGSWKLLILLVLCILCLLFTQMVFWLWTVISAVASYWL